MVGREPVHAKKELLKFKTTRVEQWKDHEKVYDDSATNEIKLPDMK